MEHQGIAFQTSGQTKFDSKWLTEQVDRKIYTDINGGINGGDARILNIGYVLIMHDFHKKSDCYERLDYM